MPIARDKHDCLIANSDGEILCRRFHAAKKLTRVIYHLDF